MDVSSYLHKMTDIQENILSFLDNETDWKNCLQEIQDYIIQQNIPDQFLKEFLYLISKITENHHRSVDFFKKIGCLLLFLKEKITQNFTNSSIFNIFKGNKRILLFLIEEGIMKIDNHIISIIKQPEYNQKHYFEYFLPEITNFKMNKDQIKVGEKFNKKRKTGENDNIICSLIRNDSIEDFIIYITKNNISLVSVIEESIFETNSFLLMKKDITLIEYAAFFGSIQIFQYLKLNNVELKSSLWTYTIHGQNADLIHLLEENNVNPPMKNYGIYLVEAIKCHFNNLFIYILDKYISKTDDVTNIVISKALRSYNFAVIPKNFNVSNDYYYYLCKYDHLFLCKMFLNNPEINVNYEQISCYVLI